jgi:hypothetical protein
MPAIDMTFLAKLEPGFLDPFLQQLQRDRCHFVKSRLTLVQINPKVIKAIDFTERFGDRLDTMLAGHPLDFNGSHDGKLLSPPRSKTPRNIAAS